jgi:hypothetical protein
MVVFIHRSVTTEEIAMRTGDKAIRLSAPIFSLPRHRRRRARSMKRERSSLLRRWLSRGEATTFQRCLAIHIHFAGPHSGLS